MPTRFLHSRFFLLVLALALGSGVARAQPLASDRAAVEQALERGAQLERQNRWGEAVSHYEELLRSHPERPELSQRVSTARMRFDVARRYADSGFVSSVARLSEADAVELLNEVLLKIHTHYVGAPKWQELLARAFEQLETSLADEAFVKKNGCRGDAAARENLSAQLRQISQRLPLTSREDTVTAALTAARAAQQQVGLAPAVAVAELACGASGTLDEYSSFLTAAQLDDVYSQIEGNFVGVGIEIKAEFQSLLLVSVIPGSPADRGGLKPGDRIVGVEGKSLRDISPEAAADLLKGLQGTTVTIDALTAGQHERRVQLRRERVEVSSVEQAHIADPEYGVGYFKISSFQKTTSRDVDAALWQLHRQGMKTLVIDLRGNPGGLLTGAVEVADKFLDNGNIVETRGRSANEDFDYKAHPVGTWQTPLVVLIDHDSASASEIFAAAVRDHRRATLVGERSYGKGSVQGIFPLSQSGVGVRLTTAKFYSPHGKPISRVGVEPDVQVRKTLKPVPVDDPLAAAQAAVENASAEDLVLQTGVQLARQRLSQR